MDKQWSAMLGILSVPKILFYVVMAALAFWIVMGNFPTGWIYDVISKGDGNVGQKPDATVQQLTSLSTLGQVQEWKEVPFTVTSDTFIFAPLAKLRDPNEKGIHHTNRRTGYQKIEYKIYTHLKYPTTFFTKALYAFGISASYNNYYLVKLEDGNYIGVFFDNYHIAKNMFGGTVELPTGYIRYADTDEKKMLNQVSQEYAVNTEFILDMYNHNKMSWVIDKLLRLSIVIAVIAVSLILKKVFIMPKK